MEKWFVFHAYNSEPYYGFGTEDEANRYADVINVNRVIDVYSVHEITDVCVLAELDSGRNTDGFRLDEALEALDEALR